MAGTIYETHNGRKLVHMGRFSNTMGRRIADPVQQWLDFFFLHDKVSRTFFFYMDTREHWRRMSGAESS